MCTRYAEMLMELDGMAMLGGTIVNYKKEQPTKEMEKIEQNTGHSFSVSQIRNIANYDERNSLLSQTNLVNAIRQQNPTIDKGHLTKFNNEIKEFILNEVHV